MRQPILKSLALFLIVLSPAVVWAQPIVHEKLRPAVIYIEVSGINEQGSVEAMGTGVIITPEGLAITARHVIAPMFNVPLDQRNMSARVGFKTGAEFQFEIISDDPSRDIAIIKLKEGIGDFDHVCISRTKISGGVALSQGFPRNLSYISVEGPINSSDGPGGTVLTSFGAPAGMSGAPVYLSDGIVRGILKGSFAENDAPTDDLLVRDPGGRFSAVVPLDGVSGIPEIPASCSDQPQAVDSTPPTRIISIDQEKVTEGFSFDDPKAEVVLSGRILYGREPVTIRAKLIRADNAQLIGIDPEADTPAGLPGEDGALGQPAPSRSGGRGGDGGSGGPGGQGENGTSAGSVRLIAQEFHGRLQIDTSGQRGSDGGRGGRGGDGGAGAQGASGVNAFLSCKAGPQNGGDGGNAGRGGDGGNGGNGGDAGNVEIEIENIAPDAAIEIAAIAGSPGQGSEGGSPGRPGLPGPRGAETEFCSGAGRGEGRMGQPAAGGLNGKTGEAGKTGYIEIQTGDRKILTQGTGKIP